MQNKKLNLIVLFLLGMCLTGLHAQESIPASGGNVSGSKGSASYSIGQVVYTTISGINGIVPQGVQQTYSISATASPELSRNISLNFAAYPNPASDLLTLKIIKTDDFSFGIYSFRLYDSNGKLLQIGKTINLETSISLAGLSSSLYLLKVFNSDKEVASFNLIKK